LKSPKRRLALEIQEMTTAHNTDKEAQRALKEEALRSTTAELTQARSQDFVPALAPINVQVRGTGVDSHCPLALRLNGSSNDD
jgi:hypothetical protein